MSIRHSGTSIETKTINTAISSAEREIEPMNECRTHLIADVVTGKVDVRDIEVEKLAEDDDLEDVVDSSVIAEEGVDEEVLYDS